MCLVADRVLREQDRALAQRLAALETKVRALSLRTWQGAVRSSPQLESVTPPSPTSYSVMVSVTVPAGRWIVLATAAAGPVGDLVNPEQIVFSVFAYDAETNEILSDDQFDNPSGYMYWRGGDVPPSIQSVSLVNDVTYDADILVVFAAGNIGGAPFVVSEPRLRLLPV